MEYQELIEAVDDMPETKRKEYRRLLSLATIGGSVRHGMEEHLESACTVDDFFEAIFEDDALRNTNVWGAWASDRKKNWIDRFEPDRAFTGVKIEQKGFVVESPDVEFFIPVGGRGRYGSLYEFKDGAFNEDAAEYFTSISGRFTCVGIAFEGSYDVFVSGRSVIFERWEFDALGNRLNGKGETKQCCACR